MSALISLQRPAPLGTLSVAARPAAIDASHPMPASQPAGPGATSS